MFGFNLGFDQNKYLLEQKKQVLESKAKKSAPVQEKKKEETEKVKNSLSEKDEIKKIIENATMNVNKIQINFQNSFVNRDTQKAYDELLENNNKNEGDNLIVIKHIEDKGSINLGDSAIVNPEKEIVLIESYTALDQNRENSEVFSSMRNEIDSKLEKSKATEVVEYEDEKFNYEINEDDEDDHNDYLDFKKEYLDVEEEKEENGIGVTGPQEESVLFCNQSTSLGTLKIETIEKIEKGMEGLKKNSEERVNPKTLSKTVKQKTMLNLENISNGSKNIINYFKLLEKESADTNKNQSNGKNVETKIEAQSEIPEDIEIQNDETEVCQETEHPKISMKEETNLVKEEMNKVINKILDKQIEKREVKKDKLYVVLQNLYNLNEKENSKDFVKEYEHRVQKIENDLKTSSSISTKNYLIRSNSKQQQVDFTDSLAQGGFFANPLAISRELIQHPTQPLNNTCGNDNAINTRDSLNYKEDQNQPNKITFQNFHQKEDQEEMINDMLKIYEESIKSKIEFEGYPVNENYLRQKSDTIKGQESLSFHQNQSLKQSLRNTPSIIGNTNEMNTIEKIIKENNKYENLFENDITNMGSINKWDKDENLDNDLEEDNPFSEENILENNKTANIDDIIKSINKLKQRNEEEFDDVCDQNKQLIVFNNFKDTKEFQIQLQKLEKIREKKLKQVDLLMKEKEKKKKVEKPVEHSKITAKPTPKKDQATSVKPTKEEIIYQEIIQTPATKKDKNSKLTPNISLAEYSQDQPRTPIVIKSEKSEKANRVIKQVNYKYNKLSNKQTIKSAISQVLMAGEVNKPVRDKILPILESCPCSNFLILFKNNTGRLDLKAIYTYDVQLQRIELLTCLTDSPLVIDPSIIKSFFKYDIVQRDFKLLAETKQLSIIVDAIKIHKV